MISIRIFSLISSNFYIKNKPLRNFALPAQANWRKRGGFSFFVTINNASYSAAALAASTAQAAGKPLGFGIALLLPARRNSVKDKRRFCLYDEIN